jgi:hypothetical protein
MSDQNERLEAMVLSLRDQLDALGERLEARLAEQARALHRLQAGLVELECAVRVDALERSDDGPTLDARV